jgi:RNA polymerase sigma-70 factor, ECF subfamily
MYPDELALPKDENARAQESTLDRVNVSVGLSFEELFELYSSMVFGVALHVLGDREEALDVSQEVFIAIFRKMGSFRGESSLKTWIYRIVIRKASNRLRWWSRLRRKGTVSLESHLTKESVGQFVDGLKSDVQSPEDALLIKEEQAQIARLLLELPLHQRIAVVMRDIQGLSYEEIAESLSVSLGTVKSRIARGRELLKRHFKGRGIEAGGCHVVHPGV